MRSPVFNLKFDVQLRNPVSRTWSVWWWCTRIDASSRIDEKHAYIVKAINDTLSDFDDPWTNKGYVRQFQELYALYAGRSRIQDGSEAL